MRGDFLTISKKLKNKFVSDALDPATLISVGVPCYNHEKFVVDTLQSIYESDWSNIELIIIDDGSSDKSYDVAQCWIDKNRARFARVHLTKQENAGICKTLNRLFAMANGHFFALIASDDKMDVDSLRVRASALASNQYADAIYSDSRFMTEAGKALPETLHKSCKSHTASLLSRKFQFRELLLCWSGGGPGLMLRRSGNCFPQMGPFCEDLPYEDLEFYLRLSVQGRLKYLPQVLQSYRIVEQSFSRSKDKHKVLVTGYQRALIKIQPLASMYNKILISLKLLRLKADSWESLTLNRIARLAVHALCAIIRKLHRINADVYFRYHGGN